MASTPYDLPTHACAAAIPKAKVVISTTGLVWEQKGQIHSPLRVHMESVDILISEEAQQDMDLKSAFVSSNPWGSQAKPWGCCSVAEDLKEHRALLLKAGIGLRADHRWYMPHELPAVLYELIQSSSEFPLDALHQDAQAACHTLLGTRWRTKEDNPSSTPLGASLQAAHKDLRRVT